MRTRIFSLLVLCLVCLFSAEAQIVNETASSIVLNEKTADVSIVLENPANSFDGAIRLELLDAENKIRANAAQNLRIKKGKGTYKIQIPLGDLLKEAEDEIAWYRLRYSVGEKSGIISLSQLFRDIFDLRVIASSNVFAGMNYHVRARAVHPFTNQPVKNIKIRGELTLDVDNEENDGELKLTGKGITDADGFAVLEFKIPADAKIEDDGELKITGERYGIKREIEEDVNALGQNTGVYINTDKPLYQPGQTLNVRGLLMEGAFENTVVSDAELEFSVKDEGDTVLFRETVKTSGFGIASVSWQIPENAKLGTYTISVEDEDGEQVGYERIKVSRYDLPQFVVKTKTDREFYLPTQDTAEVEIRADYLFGKPVTKGKVRLVREDERRWDYRKQNWDIEEQETFEGETDADGKFTAKVDLSEFHNELKNKGYSRYQDLNFAAYFTDLTTNRTEQRRFDLRVTKEAIHVYFVGETYNRSQNLPLTYFVSTFYADGTPASAAVTINGKYENETNFRSIAQIKTNAYGAGKLEFIAPKNTDIGKDFELKLIAVDGRLQTGTFVEEIDFSANDRLQIRTDKAIYKPNETIKAEIVSTKKDGLVFVDLVSDGSVVESRFVQLKDGRGEIKFPFKPEFKGEMTIAAYTEIVDEDDEAEIISDSRGIIFPKPQNLSLDANFSRETYRPNEVAKINFSVLAPDKTPIESALGVVIFDKAIEERAKTDADFGGNYRGMFERFYGLLGLSESFGGISMKYLNEINISKPISPDLQLAAELMLANNNYYPRIYGSRDDVPQARSVFGEYLDRQLAPIEAALKNAYAKDYSRPANEISLVKFLLENEIDFNGLCDPWGVGFRPKFEIEEVNDVLDIQSAGADKKFETKDDFTVLKMSFSYFLPTGKTIDRAVSDYHKATGAFIRDYKTLRDELWKQNFDLDNFRDRWNRPYRIEFGVNQRNFKIVFYSFGANGVVEERDWNTDDFTAWTSEIDYFADTSVKIQNLLNDFAGEKGFYPKNEAEFKEVLKKKNFDFEQIQDGYGQNVYLTFTKYSRFSDKLKIENTARYGENPSQKTTLEPVTQEVIAFKIRSKGEDLKEGTFDDFDLAFYSGAISEQSRTGEKTKPTFPVITFGGNGAIQGVAKDAMGAVIPGATIKATKNDTAEEFPAETEANGEYLIENLPSGKYSVRASSMGFKDSVISDVPVRASSITRADFTLEAGAIQETVTVSAGVVTVETTSSQISYGRGSGSGIGDGDGGGGGGGKKEENISENQLQISTPRLREYFPETLVWNPELVTDKNGRAELKFKLADNITTWKLYTIASTKNGKIGVAEKEFRAFQPFFVDLEPPKFLTEGDEIFLPAQVRNYTEKKQKVDVSMAKSDWFSFLNSERQQVEVAPNNSENAVFGFKAISAIKDGKQRVAAIANKDSDAIEKPVTVRPNGQEIVKEESKLFRQTGVFNVNFPANALPKTQKAELKIYPNLFSHVAESVEGLLQRPYGCGEQTISSTYPNLMILKFSDAATRGNGDAERKDSSSKSLREKAKRNLLKGYERLLGYQTASGGFSYWGGKDSADIALTAYAIRFLNDAKDFIEIDEEVIKKAQIWLSTQQRTDGSFAKKYSWENAEDANRSKLFTTYVARTLAMLNKDVRKDEPDAGETLSLQALQKALAYLKQRKSEIDEPYAMALFGLASLDAGNLEDAKAIADRLEKMAIEEGGTVYWNLETNTPFYGWGTAGRIETTALVLQLLIRDKEMRGRGDAGRDELISKATMFLLKNKDRYGVWYSTQTTINVLDAFLASLAEKRAPVAAENQNIEILLNGGHLQNISVSPDQITPFVLDLSDKISPTKNRIEIKSQAGSSLMSQLVASHYIDWRDAEISSQNASESRQIRLDYKCDRQTAEIMQEVVCSVEAERTGFRGYGMLLAEIGLPPGADVSRESLQAALDADWSLSRYEVLPDRIILYMWSKAGGTRFNFKFKPRYGINAQTPASTIYDYYNEEARATVAPLKFEVK